MQSVCYSLVDVQSRLTIDLTKYKHSIAAEILSSISAAIRVTVNKDSYVIHHNAPITAGELRRLGRRLSLKLSSLSAKAKKIYRYSDGNGALAVSTQLFRKTN